MATDRCPQIPIEQVLAWQGSAHLETIGRSRLGRDIGAVRLGSGSLHVSLIGGCHADEPVGPAMLDTFASFLAARPPDDPLLTEVTWSLVPHVNPDGAVRNSAWSDSTAVLRDHLGAEDNGYRMREYARHVVRELPGDDIEFGFPHDITDLDARPEAQAVAAFLRGGGPFHVHGSLHGMAFAPGPWFLIEPAWIDRTTAMRDSLRRRVREMGYGLLDWDRQGDKGFFYIDEGFSTRPDSVAMRRHFRDLGDDDTAALFRPSSMELVRSLGGDALTFVSEMPLFLHPDEGTPADGREAFRTWLADYVGLESPQAAARAAAEAGIRPMPIRDQMRLQLAFIQGAITAVCESGALNPPAAG